MVCHLYSAFLVKLSTQSTFYYKCHSPSHTHVSSTLSNIHTLTPMDSVSSGLLGVQKIIANLKSTVAAGTMTYYGVCRLPQLFG